VELALVSAATLSHFELTGKITGYRSWKSISFHLFTWVRLVAEGLIIAGNFGNTQSEIQLSYRCPEVLL
jgi:hypothetical protein